MRRVAFGHGTADTNGKSACADAYIDTYLLDRTVTPAGADCPS